MHMVANFWPGATLKKFQVELAQLEVKKQPQAQLLRTVAEVEGGAEDRVPLGRVWWWITTPCCLPAEWLGPELPSRLNIAKLRQELEQQSGRHHQPLLSMS